MWWQTPREEYQWFVDGQFEPVVRNREELSRDEQEGLCPLAGWDGPYLRTLIVNVIPRANMRTSKGHAPDHCGRCCMRPYHISGIATDR